MKINNDIQELLLPSSKEDKLTFEAQMIHLNFIAKLTDIMKFKGIKSKKELAKLLETSPSYITQLFSGEKLVNLKLLAKIQEVLGLKYNIVSNQYERLKNNFYNNLASQGYRELKIPQKINKTDFKIKKGA